MALLRDIPVCQHHQADIHPLLQYLALRCLGVSEIHHLIQQLVNDDEIVPYRLLLEFFEVLGQDLPVQQWLVPDHSRNKGGGGRR